MMLIVIALALGICACQVSYGVREETTKEFCERKYYSYYDVNGCRLRFGDIE